MRAALAGTIAMLAGATVAPAPARALNDDVMRNILSPVYLVQNLAAVCERFDPGFAGRFRSKSGDATSLIRHMQDEILATMTREEAAPIVIGAAGAARAVGLGMIRSLAGGSVDEQATRIKTLCTRVVTPLVAALIEEHEERHEFLEKMLRDARQG